MKEMSHAEKLQRLTEFENLKENWDSYGGLPPTEAALAVAKEFLVELENPFMAPTPDGGLTFEWNLPSGKTVIVEIQPSGSALGE